MPCWRLTKEIREQIPPPANSSCRARNRKGACLRRGEICRLAIIGDSATDSSVGMLSLVRYRPRYPCRSEDFQV